MRHSARFDTLFRPYIPNLHHPIKTVKIQPVLTRPNTAPSSIKPSLQPMVSNGQITYLVQYGDNSSSNFATLNNVDIRSVGIVQNGMSGGPWVDPLIFH